MVYGRTPLDLRGLEQLVDPSQTRAIAQAISGQFCPVFLHHPIRRGAQGFYRHHAGIIMAANEIIGGKAFPFAYAGFGIGMKKLVEIKHDNPIFTKVILFKFLDKDACDVLAKSIKKNDLLSFQIRYLSV